MTILPMRSFDPSDYDTTDCDNTDHACTNTASTDCYLLILTIQFYFFVPLTLVILIWMFPILST